MKRPALPALVWIGFALLSSGWFNPLAAHAQPPKAAEFPFVPDPIADHSAGRVGDSLKRVGSSFISKELLMNAVTNTANCSPAKSSTIATRSRRFVATRGPKKRGEIYGSW